MEENHADREPGAVTPDVRYTNGGGKGVVSFSLAVQAGKNAQGEALAHWYTCDAWERLAGHLRAIPAQGEQGACAGAAPGGGLSEQAGRETSGGPESDGCTS